MEMANNTTAAPPVDMIDLRLSTLESALDQIFLLIMGIWVLFMQCGFAFLEAGTVRSKNTSNILIKNLLDPFLAGIAYWLLGYPFAYSTGNAFIGYSNFASSDMEDSDLAFFFYQFVFAATAATIVSGAIAERCEFHAYFVYSVGITSFIYPVATRWVWSDSAWLTRGDDYEINGVMETVGFQDFAGSGVLHTLGGVAAFFGAFVCGPRIGRFHKDTGTVITIRGHSVPFAALGGFILFCGFMAFNGGSMMTLSNPGDAATVSLAIANTVISGCFGAFTTLSITRSGFFGNSTWSLLNTINGGLAGMVSVCASCNTIRPWGAAIAGIGGGIIYKFLSWAMIRLQVDDPLDAVAVHFGSGCWGVICLAFLKYDTGILMSWDKRSALMLAWQVAGLLVIVTWTSVMCAIMFGSMRLAGILRVSPEMERKGLDIPKHGEPAYPLESYGHGYLEKVLTVLENGELHALFQGNRRGKFGASNGHYESPEVRAMSHDYKFSTESIIAELAERDSERGSEREYPLHEHVAINAIPEEGTSKTMV